MKIEIIEKKWFKQRWHFRIVAKNGRILASSENYYNRSDLADAIVLIRKEVGKAEIIDKTITR